MVRVLYRGRRVVVFMGRRGRETVRLRVARKPHVCEECHRPINPGDWYFEDHITYVGRKRSGEGYLWHHRHIVCPRCWRGPKPLEYLASYRAARSRGV